MAYDDGLAQILRDDLQHEVGLEERHMFGGLAFFLHGNLFCGVQARGAMFRVGKGNEERAKSISGATDMRFTGRRMGGFIEVADDESRSQWLAMSLEHAASLSSK